MSFIYDNKNLIDELIRSGLYFESRFLKNGQGMPLSESDIGATTNSAATYANLALKLLDDIEASAAQATHPELGTLNITSGTGDADLTSIHLENLGSLIQFLIDNKIMVDYTRIAYNDKEDHKNEDYRLFNIETTPAFAQIGYNSSGFYINRDLLTKYLKSLQAAAHQKDIKLMEVQLKARIEDAKNLLGLKDIVPIYKPSAKPGETAEKPADKSVEKPGVVVPTTGAPTAQDMQNLFQDLPLNRTNIDFTRIRRFFNTLKSFLSKFAANQPRKSEIDGHMARAEETMKHAEELYGQPVVAINAGWDTIKNRLGQSGSKAYPVAMKYRPFFDQLQTIVTDTGDAVRIIYDLYADRSGLSEDVKRTIYGQFEGQNPVYKDNANKVVNLLSDANSDRSMKLSGEK